MLCVCALHSALAAAIDAPSFINSFMRHSHSSAAATLLLRKTAHRGMYVRMPQQNRRRAVCCVVPVVEVMRQGGTGTRVRCLYCGFMCCVCVGACVLAQLLYMQQHVGTVWRV